MPGGRDAGAGKLPSQRGPTMKEQELKLKPTPSEMEARRVAEEAREAEWREPSFLKELFLGNFHLHLIHPFPDPSTPPRPEYLDFYRKMERFLRERVDSDRIDREGRIPADVVEDLKRMGAFGMK